MTCENTPSPLLEKLQSNVREITRFAAKL